ncbi:MAG: nucleoside hydrolase [Clostridia bacterium]
MKKLLIAILAMVMMLSSATAFAALEDFEVVTNAEDNKVIFDTDMLYMSDDSIALFALLQADKAGWIDLLGVTAVGGNCLVAPGTAAILNQLELLERTDIPTYMGIDVPMMGFRDLEADAKLYGDFQWTGGYHQLENYTRDYLNLGELGKSDWGAGAGDWGIPKTRAQEMDAVDFMIESVHKYPGKVTIFAVGACTNVAAAIIKDPDFAKNAAGIVYMGGAIDVPGNASTLAEFNWWYDPDSVAVALRGDWAYQIIVPHDVAPKVLMAKDVLDMYAANNNTLVTKLLVDKLTPTYTENPTVTGYCWDPITVATFLCPDLITQSEVRDVAMETTKGYCYGKAVSWEAGKGPYNSAECTIVFDVDRDAFWTFLADMFGTQF